MQVSCYYYFERRALSSKCFLIFIIFFFFIEVLSCCKNILYIHHNVTSEFDIRIVAYQSENLYVFLRIQYNEWKEKYNI